MSIITSYFAHYKGSHGVCIAIRAPTGFNGEYYPALAPRWDFVMKYKKDHDEAAYRHEYQKQVLSLLDPKEVYADLDGKAMLCWEGAGKFCHRRLVAEWLENNLGVKVPEL
jgi:hypothetical protein